MADNVTPQDEKRFAIVPLSYENKDRALPGEIIMDEETGNLYVKNSKDGQLRCATKEVSDTIKEVVDARMETLKYALNNNRAVYRFYFDNTMVRLDSSLDLPEEYVYFQVRDISRETKYYLTELTRVDRTGVSIYPEDLTGNVIDALHHNGTYFVEFYNISLELVSQLVFTAKRVSGAAPINNGIDKFINYITVSTNRNILYLGESIKSINTRVYAVMGDSSSIDITGQAKLEAALSDGSILDVTDDTLTFVDLSDIDTKTEGIYKIRATFMNRMDGRVYNASTKVEVTKTPDQQLMPGGNSIILIPNYSVSNDNFTMRCIGYFEDGTIRDITDNVSLSPNVLKPDPDTGIASGKVIVIFNEGQITQANIQKEVSFFTNDGLAYMDSERQIHYNNENDDKLVCLSSNYIINGSRYRVRNIDISLGDAGYYTGTQYGHTGYPVAYTNVNGLDLTPDEEVIVELYNKDLGFTGAVLLRPTFAIDAEFGK